MKIFFAVVVIVLLFVIGATLYVYKKSAMFLPALLGICGFPKIKESSYYDENGHFRPGTGEGWSSGSSRKGTLPWRDA